MKPSNITVPRTMRDARFQSSFNEREPGAAMEVPYKASAGYGPLWWAAMCAVAVGAAVVIAAWSPT